MSFEVGAEWIETFIIKNIGTLYLIAQTMGAGLAGGVLRGIFGLKRSIE